METAGATKIFSSSKEQPGLFYNSFYGNGDKAYPAVHDIYGPIKLIKKFECVSYYQKCVGSRLRHLIKKHKRTGRERKTH